MFTVNIVKIYMQSILRLLFVNLHVALSEQCLHGSHIGPSHKILPLTLTVNFVVHCQKMF